MPPCVMGRERYAGTQRLNPHHAKRQQAFISVRTTVRGKSLPRNISANPPKVEEAAVASILPNLGFFDAALNP